MTFIIKSPTSLSVVCQMQHKWGGEQTNKCNDLVIIANRIYK
uniref:Uncharacterized protein n=1 Tax=Rhizophora mucronata TaxID=61149 RepID=A0A2P2N735_RHIMU